MFWETWALKSQVRQEGGVSFGWGRGWRGRRVGDDCIRFESEPSASLQRARFAFPHSSDDSLSSFLKEGRQIKKRERGRGAAPPPLVLLACPPSPGRVDTVSHPMLLGNPFPLSPNEMPSHSSPSCDSPGVSGHSLPARQPVGHHQTVNPLTPHGHWSASWPAPTCSLASSL